MEELLHCQAYDAHPDLCAALDHLLSSGGKRIRPTLGLLCGKMLGAPHDRLITLAAAVELLHTATLVHDDLIDGALLRRGIPTLNAQWSPPATVLTGDFLFARAAKLAAETNHLALMKLFADTLATIVNGELTQLFQARGLVSRENYYQRIYAKTASLIEMTARAAAMISPVEDAVIEAMRRFGYEVGMAFQMVDDVLDFTSEQAEVGKPVGSDLLQGLITLPTLYYIESHPEDPDLKILLEGDYPANRVQIERLVQSIRASRAIAQALDEARQSIERALVCLEAMPAGTERQALQTLARYIVDRKL
ncbi:MAG: polyprenyl synthetase family protein [Anaerolineales bacterium]